MKDRHLKFPGQFRIQQWMILGILILLSIFRLVLVKEMIGEPSRGIFIDSEQYLELARNLLTNGAYHSDTIPDLDLLRPPGYPIFLAVILGMTGGLLSAVVIVQFILVFVNVYLLYQLGNILGKQVVGLVAGFLLLLSPNTLFWSVTIMTECIFSFGLLLAFIWMVKSIKDQSSVWLIGFLFGLSTLIRPIGLYLIFLWTCWIFIFQRGRFGKRLAFTNSVSYLFVALLILFPWFIRNHFQHGAFTLSNVSSMTISSFHLALTLEDAEDLSWEEAKVQVAQQDNTLSTFLEVITSYPGSFFKVQLRGIARSLIGVEIGTWSRLILDREYEGSGILDTLLRGDLESLRIAFSKLQSFEDLPQMLLLFWGSGYSILLLGLGALGLVRTIKLSNPSIYGSVSLALISICYLILSPGAAGEARFRVPVEPLLAFLAALAFWKVPSVEVMARQTIRNQSGLLDENEFDEDMNNL